MGKADGVFVIDLDGMFVGTTVGDAIEGAREVGWVVGAAVAVCDIDGEGVHAPHKAGHASATASVQPRNSTIVAHSKGSVCVPHIGIAVGPVDVGMLVGVPDGVTDGTGVGASDVGTCEGAEDTTCVGLPGQAPQCAGQISGTVLEQPTNERSVGHSSGSTTKPQVGRGAVGEPVVGTGVGGSVGCTVGDVGVTVGDSVGREDGLSVGCKVGTVDGAVVGLVVG